VRRRLAIGLVAGVGMLAAGAGSAPAATLPASGATVARCATSPAGLALARTARAKTGRLSWTAPAQPPAAALAYRVFREGRRVADTEERSARVAVTAGRRYRFAVAVVRDGRVQAARCRATRTLKVPFLPASRPAGLRISASGALAWRTSRRGDGRIAGYRVFRDGTTFGQVAGTQLAVPGMATAQGATFTVAAVDDRGNLSPPSRALTLATDAPPPTAGSLHAFVLASTASSFHDFQAHYRQIGAVHATYFECNRATAQVQGRDDPRITQFARLRQVEVYARFDCQDAAPMHTILTNPAMRGAWLRTITGLAVQYGYDGVNVDFEAGDPADRAAYSSFVTELAARLHKIGKKLAVDVSAKTADDPAHPRSGLYD
jgi:hypothetical protein